MDNYKNMEMLPEDDGDEMSMLDILIVLAEQKRLIAAATILFALAGLAYAIFFTVPKYSSEVQMMPISSNVIDKGEFSVYMPANIVNGIIVSNAMMDAVIDEFKLMNKDGKAVSKIAARRELEKDIKVDADKNGVVTLEVKADAPDKAMKIADFIYEKTNAALQKMGVSAAITDKNAFLKKTIKDKFDEIQKLETPQNDTSKMASVLELYTIISQYDENKKIKDKSPVVLQLISPASIPDEKAPQGRGKIVALSTLLGLFCAVTLAFARHFWKSCENDPVTAQKKALLKKLIGFKKV